MIYLYPNLSKPDRVAAALRVIDHFEKQLNAEVRMSADNSLSLFGNESYAGEAEAAGLIVSVGGDGTVLRASKIAVEAGLPLLGINSGRLGFLCAIEMNEIPELSAESLKAMRVEERTMLSIRFNGQTRLALNDVVIARSRLAGTLSASVTRGAEQLLRFRGDGMIVSTPTGSTAYSMAAGGPIVEPDADCIILTPICAFRLNSRSVVLTSNRQISVRLPEQGDLEVVLSVDGENVPFLNGDELLVRRSEESLLMAKISDRSFYDIVFEKLNDKQETGGKTSS